jgi:hypothetical protein
MRAPDFQVEVLTIRFLQLPHNRAKRKKTSKKYMLKHMLGQAGMA